MRVVHVVIYKFVVKAKMKDVFIESWAQLTESIRQERGSLGSRLHRGDGDEWFAYAQWPSREDLERSRSRPSADPEAAERMRQCLAAPVEILSGDVHTDLLKQSGFA